jgi:hypothetical protein
MSQPVGCSGGFGVIKIGLYREPVFFYCVYYSIFPSPVWRSNFCVTLGVESTHFILIAISIDSLRIMRL